MVNDFRSKNTQPDMFLQYTYSEKFYKSHCKASVVGLIMGIAADFLRTLREHFWEYNADFWEYYWNRYIEEQIYI